MNQSDEIDISLIFSKFSSKIKNTLARYTSIIRKRGVLIIVISIAGTLVGGVYYTLKRPTYSTEMVLTSRTLSNQYCNYLIDNLAKVQIENKDVFAQKLAISMEAAQQITDIEYSKFDEKIKESKDSLVFGVPFKIKLQTYNPAIIDTLQTAIVNYLEQNEYALKRKKIEIDYNKKVIAKLQTEMAKIDTLQSVIIQKMRTKESSSGESKIVVGNQLDPINAYREGMDLYKQELHLNNALLIPENIYVIEGFTPKTKPNQPVLMVNLLTGLMMGFIAGFLIALRVG